MALQEPNWTQFPNEYIDGGYMARFRPTTTVVFMFLVRKIVGWHKDRDQDRISFSQIEEGTGLQDDTISKALEELEGADLLESVRRRGAVTLYTLKIRGQGNPKSSESPGQSNPTSSESFPKSSEGTTRNLRKTIDPKETNKKIDSLGPVGPASQFPETGRDPLLLNLGSMLQEQLKANRLGGT
jgi:hypothetical protein